MANTTNFGWETPDDTDLVKDGAAAMRTLGNSIDASFVDLKGGTTGQVLAKASNTDLDFTWSSVDPLTILDAKGDLISATAADTPARLAVGTNGQYLKANSATSTGLEWADITASATSFSLLNTGGTALTGAATITVSGLSGYNKLFARVDFASSASASSSLRFRLNGATSNYVDNYAFVGAPTVYDSAEISVDQVTDRIQFGYLSSNANSQASGVLSIDGANSSGVKTYLHSGGALPAGGAAQYVIFGGGTYVDANVISSLSIISATGNFDNGTIYVYGAN